MADSRSKRPRADLSAPKPRIMVVDDSHGVRTLVAEFLESRGYEVDTVEDGRRAMTLLESGAEVRLGSDTPVETFDPMRGLFAATARRTTDGVPLPGDEAVPMETALRLYFAFPDLAPGRPADLVAYDRDPAAIPPEDLLDLRPVLTVFGGKVTKNWASRTRSVERPGWRRFSSR